jgi:hypothetical protein
MDHTLASVLKITIYVTLKNVTTVDTTQPAFVLL